MKQVHPALQNTRLSFPISWAPASRQPCRLDCVMLCFILRMAKTPEPNGRKAHRREVAEGEKNPLSHILSPMKKPARMRPSQLPCPPAGPPQGVPVRTGSLCPGTRGLAVKSLLSVCSQPPGAQAHFTDEELELRGTRSLGGSGAVEGATTKVSQSSPSGLARSSLRGYNWAPAPNY